MKNNVAQTSNEGIGATEQFKAYLQKRRPLKIINSVQGKTKEQEPLADDSKSRANCSTSPSQANNNKSKIGRTGKGKKVKPKPAKRRG